MLELCRDYVEEYSRNIGTFRAMTTIFTWKNGKSGSRVCI